VVRVRWKKQVAVADAVHEVGFFGNQNTVARPKSAKWEHTISRLKSIWGMV
jgi:hypothetical protein